MIEVKNLTKEFGGKVVLDNISATFQKGVVNMIIGKSGSGKTILLKCLVGLIPPTSGEIWYDRLKFTGMKSREVRRLRRDIGMLFQGAALFDSRTVLENVMFPLDMFSFKNQTRAAQTRRILSGAGESVGGSKPVSFRDQRRDEKTGGHRQSHRAESEVSFLR